MNKKIKNTVKKTPLYSIYKWYLRQKIFYVNKFVIPGYDKKRSILLGLKKKFGLKYFVETGTFLGDTINNFKSDFLRLYSIELSKELALKAIDRFKEDQHIKIIYGDSGVVLKEILDELDSPALFWLDGHYSSEFFIGSDYVITAKGEKETPVVEELTSILNHKINGHVILIDDARCFNGKNDYPTIQEVKNMVGRSKHNYNIKVANDIIRIVPEK